MFVFPHVYDINVTIQLEVEKKRQRGTVTSYLNRYLDGITTSVFNTPTLS